MAYPWELIRRAQAGRRQTRPVAPQERQPAEERTPSASKTWQSRHGTYDRLMRSHDRVHTRHIGG